MNFAVRADDPLVKSAYRVLEHQFQELLRNPLGTRRSDPGALHDMRVAVRRLRSALKLFRKALPSTLVSGARARRGLSRPTAAS